MNVKIVTNTNTKCPCHVCKTLSAFNCEWEVAEQQSSTDMRWLCNQWHGTFINMNDVVDDKNRAWFRYRPCDTLKTDVIHWNQMNGSRMGVNERECDVSNVCCVDVHKLTLAHMGTCKCELSTWECVGECAGEYCEFRNGLSVWMRMWMCECEGGELAGLLQQHGLPTPRAALSGGGWYCKCWMPDD